MADKIQIADLGDLIKAAALANKHFGEQDCWWRGEGITDDAWKLKPKVYRKEYHEASLAFHFMNRAKI